MAAPAKIVNKVPRMIMTSTLTTSVDSRAVSARGRSTNGGEKKRGTQNLFYVCVCCVCVCVNVLCDCECKG